MRKTEIELWYSYKFDALRIIYKNRNKKQLVCHPNTNWFISVYPSRDKYVLAYYKKIGEL